MKKKIISKIENLKTKTSDFSVLPLGWVLTISLLSVLPLVGYFVCFDDSSFKDFLLNIGTEMIGVFVSVIFIGGIINRYRNSKWEKVDTKIKLQLNSSVELVLADFISASHLTVCYKDKIKSGIDKNRNGLLDIFFEIISDQNFSSNLEESISILKDNHFKNLERITENSEQRIYRILNQYEFRINQSPNLYTLLDNLIEYIKRLNIDLKNILIVDVELATKKKFTKNVINSLTKIFNTLKELREGFKL
ncbi:MAG: hypothetical protein V3V16_13110 [Melioribacteraceae bacterium]